MADEAEGQKEQTSARIDRTLKRRLEAQAKRERRNFTNMLEVAIEEYLAEHEPKPRR